jgi:hypothetical protein
MSASREDETFRLSQVLYQSLKGAHAAELALRDAEAWSNASLVSFFDEVRTTHLHLADRAKALLQEALVEGEEIPKTRPRMTEKTAPKVDQDSMESFPASDAPAHY